MRTRFALLVLMILPALSAQSIVVPGANTTAEAGTFSVWPYSTGASSYQLYLHRSQLNAWATGVQLTGIAFRMNGGEGTYMTDLDYLSYEVTVSESSSASFVANALASTTYADNIGPNAVVARSGPMHLVPGTLIGGTFPQPFAYTIDFTSPYTYTSGTDIVITIRHTSGQTPAPDARVDAITETAGVAWGLFSSGAASVTGQHGNAAVVRLVTVPTPNIALSRVGGIVDGGSDLASPSYSATPLDLTYTIMNQGDADLNLTGPDPVSFANAVNCSVSIQQPATLVVAPAGQASFMVTVTPAAIGPWSVEIAIDNDDPDESPFDFTLSGDAASGSEITVLRGTVDIADGGVDGVQGNLNLTYTIRNDGNEPLDLTPGAGPVIVSSESNCTVAITQPGSNTLAPAADTTFTLTITPAASGAFSFQVSIGNNDADENPFNFQVSGTFAQAINGTSGSSDDGGCSTTENHSLWMLAALAMLLLALRRRTA